MSEPMTSERLAEIRNHQQRYPNIDVRDLLAEVDRLRALRSKDMRWEARLAEGVLSGQDAVNDLAEQVERLRELTQDEDGNVLPPESELPVGVFYGVLYGTEAVR